MNSLVFARALRVGRMGLIWYIIGAALIVVTGGLGLGLVKTQGAELNRIIDQLPPAVLQVFKINISTFTDPVGYMTVRSLNLLWPIMMIAFVSGSAGGVTQMLERGTIHFELSLPISRVRWFLSRVFAGLLGAVLIVLVTFVALSAFVAAPWWRFALLGLSFATLWLGMSYAAAAFARDRGTVTGIVFGVFAVQVILATLAGVIEGADWLKNFNLWSAYDPVSVVQGDVPWGTLILWFVLGVMGIGLGVWRWRTRDLPA
jgi:ABC-2 type transport system permease protein